MDYKNFGQNLMFHAWNNMILFLLHLTICYANFLGEIEDLRFLTLGGSLLRWETKALAGKASKIASISA